MDKNPKISIITPSYNSGHYIERAIQSVLSQDYDNWEHIIVDGGSTDGTAEILKKYPHLNWISEPDEGQSDAMNKGFKMSKGDIIGYLNADDKFEPNVFSGIVNEFKKRKHIDLLFGNLMCVFSDGRRITNVAQDKLFKILNYWPCKFPLNSLSYFYKRHVQISIGDFPTDNHYSMDYWFLLRAYHNFKIYYYPVLLGYFYYMDNKSIDEKRARKSLKEERNKFFRVNPALAVGYFFRQLRSNTGYLLYRLKKPL